MGPIKFLYNSKFDFTAKSWVTSTGVIRRVLYTLALHLQFLAVLNPLFGNLLSQMSENLMDLDGRLTNI